jgi:hypothetical protein
MQAANGLVTACRTDDGETGLRIELELYEASYGLTLTRPRP